jgi:hypothetical protein
MEFKNRHWIDFLLFAITVVVAYASHWTASDIVWSMWISSLVLGYSFILSSTAVSVIRPKEPFEPIYCAFRSIGALPMLIFFTFHFGFFHCGHAHIMSDFFPIIPGVSSRGNNGSEISNFIAFIKICLIRYWPFVLTSAIYQYENYKKALNSEPGIMTLWAYVNVMKNHVMIFVVAFLNSQKLNSLILLSVLFLYFFPFGALFPKKDPKESDPSDETKIKTS